MNGCERQRLNGYLIFSLIDREASGKPELRFQEETMSQ